MQKLTFLFVCLFFTYFYASAQQSPIAILVKTAIEEKTPFKKITLLDKNTNPSNPYANVVKAATFLQINLKQLKSIVKQAPKALLLDIPYGNTVFSLELVQISLWEDDFTVSTAQSSEISYLGGVFYRGTIKGDAQSVVALSFFEDELYGVVSNKNGNYVLGHLERKNSLDQYIFYKDSDLIERTTFGCATQETSDYGQKVRELLDKNGNSSSRSGRCLRVFLEGDYTLLQEKGNLKLAVNYLAALFNNVAALYQNEQISIKLSGILVWDTPDDYHRSSPSIALIQFRNHRPNFEGDLAYLAHFGADSTSTRAGGLSDLNTLCDGVKTNDYGYTPMRLHYKEVPVYSWSVMVLAHEMGHNLGSPHTHSCSWLDGALDDCAVPEGKCAFGPTPSNGGTIMSYCHLSSVGINFSNGFGIYPGKLIRSRVGGAGCLDICTNNVLCQIPSKISIRNNNINTVTLTWDSLPNSKAYSIQWKRAAASTWISIYKINQHRYSLTGLSPNTIYTVRVRAYCSNSISDYSQEATFVTLSKELLNQQPSSAIDNKIVEETLPQPNEQSYEGNNPILTDGLSVTPNPVSDLLNVNFKFLTKKNIHLSLLNLYGTVLYEDNFSLREGSASLDISQYPAALYFVRATINDKEVLLKKVAKE
jgi:Metallo-peptidase family M12/Secretion system C-terminal sorting domain/Fibronectin type III domain